MRSAEAPRILRTAALATLPFFALVAAGACDGDGDGGGGGTGPSPTVATVEVTPSSATLSEVGATQQFSATARDQDGNAISGVSFDWDSDDQTVATVDENGLATAQGDGTANIGATAQGVTGSGQLTVSTAQPASIEPASGGGQNGMTTRQFPNPLSVVVTDEEGNHPSGVTINWSVQQGAVTLSAQSSVTDDVGMAEITVTADTLLVSHVVRATLPNATTADSTVDFDLETTVAWFRIGDNFFEDWEGRRNTNFRATGNIVVGDTVMWEYVSGADIHTVTSGEGVNGADGNGTPTGGTSIGSSNLSPGDTFRWVPDAAGTWTYFCQIHPDEMFNAEIEVSSGGGLKSAAAGGSRYEVGDVVRPEGSPFAFIYLGPPSSEAESEPLER